MNFDAFSFHPQIKAGIVSAGYSNPTDIQLRCIPAILDGRDVLGLAQTGTGKTAAFALPILERLVRGQRGKLRALILSPTRELAHQTHMAFTALGRQTRLRSQTIYGGVSQLPQVRGLRDGAEIAVACPGRLLDLMGQRAVNLNAVEVVVLDEADQMFDMGFLPSIRRILAALPAARQTLLFSATMPSEVRSLVDEMLHDPIKVEIGVSRPVESIRHAIYPVEQTRKSELLQALLRQVGDGQALVFTRTKHRAKKLADVLAKAGFSTASLQGNLSQNRRQEAMDGFRSGRVQVLVATDIAARGIDVSRISHVINFDLPDTAEAYTHRIGRTGRMARSGTAYSLVTGEDLGMVRTIERLLGHALERRDLAGFDAALPAVPQPVQTAVRPAQPAVRPTPSTSRPAQPAGHAGPDQPRRRPDRRSYAPGRASKAQRSRA